MTEISGKTVPNGLVCRFFNAATDSSEFSQTLGELKRRMEQQSRIFFGEDHTDNRFPRPPEERVFPSLEKVLSTLPELTKVENVPRRVEPVHQLFVGDAEYKLSVEVPEQKPAEELPNDVIESNEELKPPPPFERSKTIVVIPTVVRQKTFICEDSEVRANVIPPSDVPPKSSINTTVSAPTRPQSRKGAGQPVRGPRVSGQRARWVRPQSTATYELSRRPAVPTAAVAAVQQKSIAKSRMCTPKSQSPSQSQQAAMKASASASVSATPIPHPAPATLSRLATPPFHSPQTPRQVSPR